MKMINSATTCDLRDVGWLPIESAPKDGTEIVLYYKEEGPCIGKWMDKKEDIHAYKRFKDWSEPRFEPKLLFYHGCGECCQDPYPPEPTHWTYLPDFITKDN